MWKKSLIASVFLGSVVGVGLKALHVPPNIELLMPFVMAFSILSGPLYGFVAGMGIRAVYDVYMSWVGPWTFFTSLSYGVVGLVVGLFSLRKRWWSRAELVALTIFVTLLYDLLTILPFGMMFRLRLVPLLIAQIPFSINHVLGNCFFVFLFVPYIMKFLRKVEDVNFSLECEKILKIILCRW